MAPSSRPVPRSRFVDPHTAPSGPSRSAAGSPAFSARKTCDGARRRSAATIPQHSFGQVLARVRDHLVDQGLGDPHGDEAYHQTVMSTASSSSIDFVQRPEDRYF